MRIRYQFRLSEPIHLQDRWPIIVDGVTYAFIGDISAITHIAATVFEQSINLAPTIDKSGKIPKIHFHHGAELSSILEKIDQIQCTIGILLPVEIDMEHYQVFFEAENVDEQARIVVKEWASEKRTHNNRVSFDVAAKGLLAHPWPTNERNAAQFYRRGRSAINERYFVDAFVNYYFFLERLYAGGKFKTSEVVHRFAQSADFQRAFSQLDIKSHDDAIRRGAPLNEGVEKFSEWIVNRRGFFQHQSETDPSRWLHATQEKYSAEAVLLAHFAMSIYNIRNGHRIFSEELDKRWIAAAEEVNATMQILVDIIGDKPDGQSFRHQVAVNGPGTHVTLDIARDTLMKCMELADRNLIAVRQMTATVKGTHELVFSYTGPATPQAESRQGKLTP